ncbi:MAG: N-formylglutamate amidohydrolase [Deltaproteobacteria bacterium]
MRLPFVLSLPHASSLIPARLRPVLALTDSEVEESTDVGTQEIFGRLPARRVLPAEWSRLVVDLNRDPAQRDAKGVVAQVDYRGRAIYREGGFPDKEEFERRLERYYLPFHRRLSESIEDPHVKGLFDCHSLYGTGPSESPDPGKKRLDITLGNNGDQAGNAVSSLGAATCPAETLHRLKKAFEKQGFSVALNYPYSGGFITRCYGEKLVRQGKIAVQIEINQDLFCDPGTMRPLPKKVSRIRSSAFRSFDEIARIV